MRQTVLLLTLVGAMLLACTGAVLAQQTSSRDAKDIIPDRYIVVLEEGTAPDTEEAEEEANEDEDEHPGLDVENVYGEVLEGYSAEIPADKVEALRDDPEVKAVVPDRVDRADVQTIPTGVRRIDGGPGASRTNYGTGVNVAVIDTGIDLTHPDLNARHGTNAIAPNTDGTGKKLCNESSRSISNDDNGHGSHVAGTIAAKNDTNGVVGVAPGANLYSVKVLDSTGSGARSDIICGIEWITSTRTDADPNNDIFVANMSLGGTANPPDSPSDANCKNAANDPYHEAICNSVKAGVTYVAAAGNDNENLAKHVPAAYDEVLTVTAEADFNGRPGGGAAATCRTDVDDTAANFSNYATTAADRAHTVAAPGVCINSTWKSGGYNTISGTSMAAPHVAGMAALFMANNQAKPADIIRRFREDARTRSGSNASVSGYYGFRDDPNSPNGTRYYDYLVHAGGYYGSGTSPETSITSGPSGTVNADPLNNTFEFSSSPDGSTFECKLDRKAFRACGSGVSYPGLTSGSHTLRVRAKDAAGSVDTTPASRTWTVDANAPTISGVTPINRREGRPVRVNVTARFSEAMDKDTLTTATFALFQGTTAGPPSQLETPVDSTAKLSADGLTARLNPYGTSTTDHLARCTWYTARLSGGAVKDRAGNALAADRIWSFKTTCS